MPGGLGPCRGLCAALPSLVVCGLQSWGSMLHAPFWLARSGARWWMAKLHRKACSQSDDAQAVSRVHLPQPRQAPVIRTMHTVRKPFPSLTLDEPAVSLVVDGEPWPGQGTWEGRPTRVCNPPHQTPTTPLRAHSHHCPSHHRLRVQLLLHRSDALPPPQQPRRANERPIGGYGCWTLCLLCSGPSNASRAQVSSLDDNNAFSRPTTLEHDGRNEPLTLPGLSGGFAPGDIGTQTPWNHGAKRMLTEKSCPAD